MYRMTASGIHGSTFPNRVRQMTDTTISSAIKMDGMRFARYPPGLNLKENILMDDIMSNDVTANMVNMKVRG